MTTLTINPLGERGKGAFGAKGVVDARALELLEKNNYFLVSASQFIIGACSDERHRQDMTRLPLPAAFGGFANVVLTDTLTTCRWYKPGMSFLQHVLTVFEAVRLEYPDAICAVHTDEHALQKMLDEPDAVNECGCAAIALASPVVRSLVEALRAYPDLIQPDYRDRVLKNAEELLRSDYFTPGTASAVDAMEEAGLAKEVLVGFHTGQLTIRNEVEGQLIDRSAFYAECTKQGLDPMLVFVDDAWARRQTAAALAGDEADFFFAGGDALSSVILCAIASSRMQVGTLTQK